MLFGHQNDDVNSMGLTPPPAPAPDPTPTLSPTLNPLAIDPVTGSSLPVPPAQPLDNNDDPAPGSILNQGPSVVSPDPLPAISLPSAPEPPTSSLDEPLDPTQSTVAANTPEPTSTPEESSAVEEPTEEATTPTEPAQDAALADSDSLLSLKQQALSELEPLVSQLDQTPEEKFRTTMMLIQSTDNQSLLKQAYDVAQSIPDEKARAQALLDVVNEINYFTQQKS